jgi:hypothetical protein
MNESRVIQWKTTAVVVLLTGAALATADVLENDFLRVEFSASGLAGITDKVSLQTVRWASDGFAVFAANESIESDYLSPTLAQQSATNRTYRFESGPWTVRVLYELQPGWRFISKQVEIAHSGKKEFRVQRLELWRGLIETPIAMAQRIRDGTLLRFADAPGGKPTHGLFLSLQNPFLQLKRQEQRLSLAYPPDSVWNPTNGAYASDRLLIGPYTLSGVSAPAKMIPEWKLAAEANRVGDAWIDRAEVDALVECVRAFLLWHPTHTTRINVGWCENDYQIDIAKPEGRTEYQRIIDQASAVGCRNILFAPANSEVASLPENRDAWGWENLLWFTMGQKLRKGEWDPAKDKLPASVQGLVDYAKAKDIGLVAYVYPSLPFMQRKEWTSWVPNGQPGGYLGADTGLRSFQDWLLDKLVAFHNTAGASGYAFDHWWIAYDETTSSKYAQWAGCRRILEELRRRVPEAVIDGRQQYHHFGVWTWLAGTYPHPLNSDEQPESFRAFPDLHWSRVSADRQRRTAYWYRTECFVPTEIMPGYMTHQTARLDAKGECPRVRFRPADWDFLGWKYSVLSSIATAPYNLVVNFIPARDPREFKAFSPGDQRWFRDWFDWTDQNLEILRHIKPILGAPQLGCVDGTAAFKDGRGFIFLFNPNYRKLPAEFQLDSSIGLASGGRFLLRQLYPEAEKGRLLASPVKPFWKLGDKVTLPLAGVEAFVLEVGPAPEQVEKPLLFGVIGKTELRERKLEITGVVGEAGSEREVGVALPAGESVSAVTVNGTPVTFRQDGSILSMKLQFAGASFSARQSIGSYDANFTGGSLKAKTTVPRRILTQLEERKRAWPVDYTDEERLAAWLNSDRLLLFINVAEPDDEAMKGVTLKVDGQDVPVKPAYTSVVRSNPKNTFTGWYADVTSLQPDVPHEVEVELPKLASGQFQGLFFDTVETEYTKEVSTAP